jgi:hypothetical protein
VHQGALTNLPPPSHHYPLVLCPIRTEYYVHKSWNTDSMVSLLPSVDQQGQQSTHHVSKIDPQSSSESRLVSLTASIFLVHFLTAYSRDLSLCRLNGPSANPSGFLVATSQMERNPTTELFNVQVHISQATDGGTPLPDLCWQC